MNLGAVFGAAFAPIYEDGFLHPKGAVQDEGGGKTRRVPADPIPIKWQPDRITEAMRARADYTDKDAVFLVLQRGPGGEVIAKPDTDVELEAGIRWHIVTVEEDPAHTHWVIRGNPA